MKPLGIVVIVVLLALAVFLLMKFGNVKRKALQKRIERIGQRKANIPKSMQDMSLRRKAAQEKGLVYWLMKPLPDFKALGDRLERAGKHVTPKQYVFQRVLWVFGILIVMMVIFKKSFWLSLAAAAVLGVWLPLKWMQRAINKEGKAFLHLFPDAIDLIVRGLRSGLPVSESLILVSHEVPDPVGSTFGNIANTMKLGVTMEKALQETARKLDLTEFNFFTTSIILQRETGGNLAEILNNLSEVLRARFIMHMKIKALSSEARASAVIIGALPFVVILAVSVLSPDYIAPLWNDPRGNICAAVAAGMMGFGLYSMHRMTQFEI